MVRPFPKKSGASKNRLQLKAAMPSVKRTFERKKRTPATPKSTRKNSEEGPPDTDEREKPTTSETPASVKGNNARHLTETLRH